MMTGKRHRSGASRAFGASRVDRNAGAGGGRDAHLDGAERRDGGEGEGGHCFCVWWRERCVRAMTRSRVAGADNLRFGKIPRQGGRSPREGPVGTLLRHHDELQWRCAAHPAALYWASTAPGARDDHRRRHFEKKMLATAYLGRLHAGRWRMCFTSILETTRLKLSTETEDN